MKFCDSIRIALFGIYLKSCLACVNPAFESPVTGKLQPRVGLLNPTFTSVEAQCLKPFQPFNGFHLFATSNMESDTTIIDDKSSHCIPFILSRLQLHQSSNPTKPFFIGLNGVQGAGKTTLV